MSSRKKLLKNARLYLILDREVNTYGRLFEILKRSLDAGVDIVQLRDKTGKDEEILDFAQKAMALIGGRIPFIVNDRVDLALQTQADGVHLGQDDLSVDHARKVMGEDAIIGSSCQTLEQAQKAEELGADYIGFGSIYKTFTKPDRNPMDLNLLSEVVKMIKIPVFAIGGIHLENAEELLRLGVSRVAVCRAISQADDVESVVGKFKSIINRHEPLEVG